jgi:recombination protein RecR
MSKKEDLQQLFKKFPGIGTRGAERFVYHILKQPEEDIKTLLSLISSIRETSRQCPLSRQFFFTNGEDFELSPIERSSERTNETLLIVATDQDISSIESSGTYKGKYFVLGGYTQLTQTTTQKDILEALRNTIEAKKDELKEIIFGLAYTKEGEHTYQTLVHEIADLLNKYSLTSTVLGRGLSKGSELEYADSQTISHALEHRS